MLISVSTVTGCISTSSFAFLDGIPIGIASSVIGLKMFNNVITAGFKKYRSIIKEQKNKNDKILSLAKSKLNSVEVFIAKALIDSNISHAEFVLISNALEEFDDIKEEIKKFYRWINYIYETMLSFCLKCRKNRESKNPKLVKTSNGRIMLFYQKVQCVITKNQNFLKNKKLVSNLLSN